MAILPNVLAPDLHVVFCGTAAGTRSAQLRAYYAGPGNKFWPTLHAVGLTPRRFSPAEYRRVLEHRVGLTDLAKRVSGPDSSLKRTDFQVKTLRRLILRHQPRYLAFTSKRAAQEFFGSDVEYGLHSDKLGRTKFFVLSSPSGLASGYWQGGKHWKQLAALVRRQPPDKSLERTRAGA